MIQELGGIWNTLLPDGTEGKTTLPGTLDESGIGYPDTGKNQWKAAAPTEENPLIRTRLTRRFVFEGEARLSRNIELSGTENKRLFVDVERSRCLRLLVDGKEYPPLSPQTISTPSTFEITGVGDGKHVFTFLSDNSYPGLPRTDILMSSAATDETQTNWNGLLGFLRLRMEAQVFIRVLSISSEIRDGVLTADLEIDAKEPFRGTAVISSEALTAPVSVPVQEGGNQFTLTNLRPDLRLWSPEDPALYRFDAVLRGSADPAAVFSVTTGFRCISSSKEGHLLLNGHRIFLFSEANCAVFPESGHPPMTVPEWEDILMRYRAYGINCMRFHSHTPPEAAFTAADRLGMLMQPELSCWNPTDAFEQDEAYFYYRDELVGILRMLSNHPSFVMLSLGNELHAGEKGHRRMDALLHLARGLDPCRLYANGSNVHYGAIGCDPESDFFASQKYYDLPLRGTFADMEGHINEIYPSTDKCYDEAMAALRKDYRKPVISFEVGQFEVLPDFQELPNFQGVTIPGNYRAILERAEKAGISKDEWRRMVEATGTLSRICYREEAEAALRTEDLSGISFLGLQDFPGQGTALVGMMNAHLQPKPYDFAKPEHFAAFLRPILPLALLPRYTYFVGDEIPLLVKHANYSEQPVHGPLRIRLLGKETAEISREDVFAPPGGLTSLGTFTLPAPDIERACALSLEIRIGNHVNTYPLWVYPKTRPVLPPDVYETRQLDDLTLDLLRAGKKVFLAPDSDRESMPHSIKGQFSTDFWSVGTFPSQEGGMGQLIDETHPVFRDFPTSFHTDWQWWPMASQRALILPRRIKTIVAELDSFAFLRPMAQLFECWVGKGRLFFSSLGLHKLQQYPEATALLSSIYRYTGSPEFEPTEELTEGEAKQLL